MKGEINPMEENKEFIADEFEEKTEQNIEVEKLKTALETQKQDYESKILRMMLDHSVETALIRAGARCVKAAKALIDEDKIQIEDNKRISGIDEQINALKADSKTAFLFEDGEVVKTMVPQEAADRPAEPEELSYEGFCAFYGDQRK